MNATETASQATRPFHFHYVAGPCPIEPSDCFSSVGADSAMNFYCIEAGPKAPNN